MALPESDARPSRWPASQQTRAPGADHWRMAEHWPELVGALTDQSVETVSLLLRGLDLLMSKGRISADEYKVLALPAERLKHCGTSAQQIVRFQSGRVRQSHEKIDLAYLLECVLQERRRELTLLGITLRRKLKAVDILIDPTLGFSLTNAMLDWGMPFGHRMDWRLELPTDNGVARLWMKVFHNGEAVPSSAVFEDNIHWLLLRQIAASDGAVALEREISPDGVELTAQFKRTVQRAEPAAAAELTQAPASVGSDSAFKSVSGAFVLVISSDAWLRNEAVSALKRLGVTVEGVLDVAQARGVLRGQSVNLVVLDTAEDPFGLRQLQLELVQTSPQLPFVEITTGADPGLPPEARLVTSRVARDNVHTALGSTVMFALSRAM